MTLTSTRVALVGGGPAGLSLSHVLWVAGMASVEDLTSGRPGIRYRDAGGGAHQIRCDVVVGADGSRSMTRRVSDGPPAGQASVSRRVCSRRPAKNVAVTVTNVSRTRAVPKPTAAPTP